MDERGIGAEAAVPEESERARRLAGGAIQCVCDEEDVAVDVAGVVVADGQQAGACGVAERLSVGAHLVMRDGDFRLGRVRERGGEESADGGDPFHWEVPKNVAASVRNSCRTASSV